MSDHTPEELGQKIGQIYVDAISKLASILKDGADGDAIRSLKEDTVQALLPLGHKHEALDSDAQKTAQNAAATTGFEVDSDAHAAMVDASSDLEGELGDVVGSFNVITQYAFFDLLRKQQPDEAARLGVD